MLKNIPEHIKVISSMYGNLILGISEILIKGSKMEENKKITRNEYRKVLYKEKPIALFIKKENDIHTYMTSTSLGKVFFDIPDDEMLGDNGERLFHEETDAQLLGRWIRVKSLPEHTS